MRVGERMPTRALSRYDPHWTSGQSILYPVLWHTSVFIPTTEPKGVGAMMDPSSKATTTKSVGSSKADATQAFRAMAGNGAKETLEKMSAAAAETTSLMQDSCSTAVKGAQDYSAKVVEFARANTEAALEFVQKLSSVKSPSEFFELSTNHSRKQFEILTEQTRELTALAQEVALAATEPLKAGAMKAFSKLS